MVTVCFRCPSCQMHVIRGLVCSDDFLALSRDLPVRLRCPGCGTESFVLRYSSRTSALPAAGEWDSTIGHCLAVAAICRLRAGEIQTVDARLFLLKMERQWLELGERCDVHQRSAIVRARVTRLWSRGRWRQSA
jgi:hypothetical protein